MIIGIVIGIVVVVVMLHFSEKDAIRYKNECKKDKAIFQAWLLTLSPKDRAVVIKLKDAGYRVEAYDENWQDCAPWAVINDIYESGYIR